MATIGRGIVDKFTSTSGAYIIYKRGNTVSIPYFPVNNLILGANSNGESSKPLTGRHRIFLVEQDLPKNGNVQDLYDLLDLIFKVHNRNAIETDFLFKYYRGEMGILDRVKDIRPEIKNIVLRNIPQEIVKFKDGFEMGEPWQYIGRGAKANSDNSDNENEVTPISILNSVMELDEKEAKDKEIWHNAHIAGNGYRMMIPAPAPYAAPIQTDSLYPGRTFVVYDPGFGKKPWLCGHYVYKTTTEATVLSLRLWSERYVWDFTGDLSTSTGWTMAGAPQNNGMGMLPIVEYAYNSERLGAFEPYISQIDAINVILSNQVDDIEQFVQALLWFSNCDITREELQEFLSSGGIKTKDSDIAPAKVTYLTQNLNQSQIQVLVDSMYQAILTGAGVPDRNANASNNTGQALVLGQGWQAAVTERQSAFSRYKRSEMLFLTRCFNVFAVEDRGYKELSTLTLADVDLARNYSVTDNLLVKVQALQGMLESGVHPKIAFNLSGLFIDPEGDYSKSKAFLVKWNPNFVAAVDSIKATSQSPTGEETPSNNKPTPE